MVVHGTSKSIFRLKNGIDHAPIPPTSGEAVFAGVFAARKLLVAECYPWSTIS
jgi:hypothetical protein